MTRVRQDDLARQRRLNGGLCPTHGVRLLVVDRTAEGHPVVLCPRDGCDFIKPLKPGTKVFAVIEKDASRRRTGG